jgi:RND family efflux transporter MFP subunit
VAPTAGVVGDIPVRVGDRVAKATVMTTVDENDALELYVNVPVQQAPRLRAGLPVRIVDDRGQTIAEHRLTFVSPSVDDATQTVLAKALLSGGRERFRADQFVRARVVWSTDPGLTVPMTAVTRINGQYFVYLAEAQGEATLARQRAVQLGEVIGNDYVLIGGLKAGDRLIVSGIQKIGDGSPVMVGAPPAQKAS